MLYLTYYRGVCLLGPYSCMPIRYNQPLPIRYNGPFSEKFFYKGVANKEQWVMLKKYWSINCLERSEILRSGD